jgi:PAS domain S-box-containing protein
MAKILIIDDRPLNRQFLTTLLGYQHHQLSEASDGAEGLRVARDERPALIICDVLMPTMDGYEFVRSLREDADIGMTPVVFSTAHYLSRESKALAQKCGVTSIIFKPCEPQAVLDIVAAALDDQAVRLPPALQQPQEFNRDHLLLVTNKAAESADELRAAHDKLSALIELSTDLAQERDPVLLLDRICSVAREVIGTRWTMVVLLEPNRKTVQHLGVAGIHLEDSPALRMALLENGVFKTVTQEGRTICLSDVTSTPTALRLPKGLPRAASLLVAPLVMRGHVDGWICLADKLGFDAFSEEDEQLAPALAAQMAVAYANARLYSDSLKYASELEGQISERTRAEEKVRESEQRLQTVIENLSEGLIVADLDGQLLNWNRAAMEIHGFASLDECLLKLPEFTNIFELSDLDGSLLDLEQWPLSRIIRGERLQNVEVRIRRLDGDWNRIFNYGGTIIREQSGRLAAIVTMSDITDRKLAEEDQMLLAAIVQSSQDAIIGKTLDGIISSWNKGAERLYGYSAEEVVGLSIAILAPSDSDDLTSILERLRRGESIDQLETRRMTKEGTQVMVSLTISPIKNSAGQVVGASTIARDVTERKQAEKALKETNQHLKQAMQALQEKTNELTSTTQQLWQASKLATMGELAASIAHELNNPLATVGLRAESLLMQLPQDSDMRKPLEIITQEVDRMATLVNNLLQFTRRSHRQVSTVDLREEVATSVEFVHYHLRTLNIQVVREFAAQLRTVQADRQQLRQLFLNLLTNAGDAMPAGGKLIVRAMTARLEGADAVAIEFADTGGGIPAANLEQIWEPFFTTKPEGKGTGLGLAICRRIVEEHGGTIDIKSPSGGGATVRMVFPATANGSAANLQ